MTNPDINRSNSSSNQFSARDMVSPASGTDSKGHGEMTSVIWITGFSGAGKTTVGRKVNALLQKMNVKTVFLDGDDLRGIFGGKWGYDRAARIELAHAYFRLCNTLAAQGITVVISAVAMYKEVFDWVRENVDRSLQIYLTVPENERVARDKATKNIYGSMGDVTNLYDVPMSSELTIENYGSTSPDTAAGLIIDAYKVKVRQAGADKGRTSHWNGYYVNSPLVYEPSDFAIHSAKQITDRMNILEVGCGNGRDSAYFSHLGHNITAIDPSVAAIDLCKEKHGSSAIKFIACKLPELSDGCGQLFNVIYSRFCFHAMTEKEEVETLSAAYKVLSPSGDIFIECRSINDPLARKGEVMSSTERHFGHYRRFIIPDELKRNLLDAGFIVKSMQESNNLAVLGDDNPVVIRVHAIKYS